MKKLTLALTLMGVLMTVAACGPEVSSEDKDRAQVDEEVSQQRAQYAPFAGTYMGTLKKTDGTVKVAQLNVQAIDNIVSNPSRNEPSAVPTLEGGLSICLSTNTCFSQMKSPSAQEDAIEDIFNLGVFNIARYDGNTQTINLSFSSATSFSSVTGTTTGGSAAPGQLIMNLHVSGKRLYGEIGTNLMPIIGTLDVTRK